MCSSDLAPAPRRVSAGPSAKPASRPAALRDAGGPGNRGWLWLLPGVLLASALAVAGFHLLPRLRVPQLSRSAAPSAAPAPSPRSLPTAVRPPAPPVASLLLSSSEPSWLSVRDGAGQSLFEGTFTGERRFPLKGGLSVMAGRPDLVKVSLGDQPSRPLGTIDQVVWHTFAPPASAVSGVPAASSAASSSITNAASGAAAPPGVPPKAPTP